MSPAIALNHVSVCAHDLDASIDFYVDLFGMERLPTPNFGFPVQWLRVGPNQFHLFERPDGPSRYQHLAFTVDNFEPLYIRAGELECFDRETFSAHLLELPGDCVQLYLRDPAGNLLEVDAKGASQLPGWLRSDMVRLADIVPQNAENLRATLFQGSQTVSGG